MISTVIMTSFLLTVVNGGNYLFLLRLDHDVKRCYIHAEGEAMEYFTGSREGAFIFPFFSASA